MVSISQTSLRGATTRASQLQAQARKIAQRASTQLRESQTQQVSQEVEDERSKALYTAAKMAISGKGESNIPRGTERYYQAIMWGDTSGFSSEERKIIEDLHSQVQGGYGEAQQKKIREVASYIQQKNLEYEKKGIQAEAWVPSVVTNPEVARITGKPIGATIGKSEYNKILQATNNFSRYSGNIKSQPKEEFNVLETSKQPSTYQDYVKDYGVVSGSLKYTGEKSKGIVKTQRLGSADYLPYEIRGTGQYNPKTKQFEPYVTSEEKRYREEIKTGITKEALSDVVQTIPYFSLAGNVVVIMTGAESIFFKKPREELYAGAESMGLPKQAGLLLPIAQIGFGAFGLRSQIKGVQLKKEFKIFQETPTQYVGKRYETGKGGFDILYGYKKVGKSEYLTQLKQPFTKVSDKKIVFESGRGLSFKLSEGGKKLDVLGFEVSGKAYSAGTGKQVGSRLLFFDETKNLLDSPLMKLIKPLEAETMYGKVGIKEIFRGKYNLKSGFVFPTGRYEISAVGNIKNIEKPIERFNIFGLAREEGGKINFVGGTTDKLRYYPKEQRYSIVAGRKKLSDFGTIFRANIQPPVEEGIGFIQPSTIQKTKFSTAPILEKVSEKTITKVKTIKSPSLIGFVSATEVKPDNILSMKSQVITETQKTKQEIIPTQTQREKQKEVIIPKLKQIPKTTQEEKLISLTTQIPQQAQRKETKLISQQSQILQQKQRQRQILLSKTKQISPKQKQKFPLLMPLSLSSIPKKTKGKDSDKDLYKVFGKRFGTDIELFKTESEQEAKGKLKSFLKSTLGRSGYIESGGRRLPFERLNLGLEFRPSKSKNEFGRVVQKARFSLSSGSEKREILRSKKKKKFNWFS
ncbi:hypothetical protein M0R19_01985 [Candidatus Pacearchaeota archaeon]|nr:hypothetical protein [Candidatus Pacearchaeota archaeon]